MILIDGIALTFSPTNPRALSDSKMVYRQMMHIFITQKIH